MELLAQGRDCDIYDLGDGTVLRRSRSLYDQAPALWTVQPHLDSGVVGDAASGRDWLGAAIEAGAHGQSLASTRSKMFVVAGALHAGILHNFPADMGEIGTRYPRIAEEERQIFEPTMRAMYGGLTHLGDEEEDRAAEWAMRFWRANWQHAASAPPPS